MLRDPIPITDQGIHQLCNVHSAGVQLVFSSNITNKYARTLSSHVIVPVFVEGDPLFIYLRVYSLHQHVYMILKCCWADFYHIIEI